MAAYYFIALLCVPPEESAPILRKINDSLVKKNMNSTDQNFMAIGHFALNEMLFFNNVLEIIENEVKSRKNDYECLINIIILYLVDRTPDTAVFDNCYNVVKKAYENGYYLQAYDASYCLLQWSNSAKNVKLHDEIKSKFSFPPVISQISHQEEWEKSLNGLLSLGGGKLAKTAKDEPASRVVYSVDFVYGEIQPRLQTRTKSGWSTGRNIALKTFKNGVIEGMTDQDHRVANKVKVSRGGYYGSEDYELPHSAIKELVGHPLVFLMGSKDILVEIVEAKPSIEVVKTTKGYLLKSDLDLMEENDFIIQKETNTRYKVYDLSVKQIAILNAISQEKILIPEKGKTKLMQVLGQFSSHLTVQSDLVVTENCNVKTVESDSKIRVQLLPLGDSFKAELFAKPFGTHPPYCKPGKGGKTLICNENGEQLQVLRNLSDETKNANALMLDIQSLESIEIVDGLIEFDDPLDSLSLLDILGNHQDKCVVEWPEGERFKIKGTASFGNLKFNIKSKAGWFDLQGELRVNESTVLSIQELLQLSHKSKNRFVELKDGEFLALSKQLKKQLEELYTFSTSGKDGLQINKFASVALTDFFDDVTDFKADKSWKAFQSRIKSVENNDVELPNNLQAELRPYQLDGFRWMARIAQWEGGACLADDMGLGKTLQSLAILLHRAPLGSALVVCPVSVVPNWINEVAKFAPTLNVKTLTSGNREQILKNLAPNDLLITSYGILQSEEKALSEIVFATIVLDEAHAIKNFTTKTSKAAMLLQAPFRVALTGTPIQNHLGEVWNLFNFINPGLLGTQKHFTDTFVKSDDEMARNHLKKLIAPFILRRLKSAVLEELPPKIEVVKKITLSEKERAYYEALRRQAIINMESDDSAQGTKHLKALAEITRLRQACCNVALVDPAIEIGSSKLATFLEIVGDLIENKHRALVFSQFVTHLSLVRVELDRLGIKYQYLDGSSPMNEREQSVKKFQSGEGDLFLISLKAGGLGLNLTAADYVIHLDPWWNPAIEDQASDRAHRFGQSRPVTIYRLVAENTIEEKIIELHNTKRDLADSLLEGSDQSAKMSMVELMSLLRERE
jgi:superfamily II DNA or RNA helicase